MTSDVAIPENINTFEDLSGTVTTAENPYDALIDACQGNSVKYLFLFLF